MQFRLTKIKECRRLTLWGWLLVAVCIAAATFVWVVTIHDFLAVTKPLDSDIWVIEGYVPDFVLRDVAAESQKNTDLLLVCAGLSMEKGAFWGNLDNYADYNAAVLRYFGADSLRIISAPAQFTHSERTYMTALAAKEKLHEKGIASGSINVVCLGTHARRSWYLYRKAFKHDWKVGIISYCNNTYAPESWWRTSEGARDVVYEMFAWLYCILFFHP